MREAKKVSVLIPAFNEEERIGRAVGSALEAFGQIGQSAFEIVVCDNNSTDRTAERARAAGARVVFEAHNQIGRARNAAAREANGEWLIFMDADSELPAGLLRETLALLESGRAAAGGALVTFDAERLAWHGQFGLAVWNACSRFLRLAAGTYIFCARSLWEEAGGFDERFYAGEEIDFSRKLKRACRRRRLRFEVIRSARIPTSARKIESHSPMRMLMTILSLVVPGALRKRKACGFWYERDHP